MEKEDQILNLNPRVQLLIQVKDRNGNVIKEIKREEDPLVRNAIRSIASALAGIDTTGKREDGSSFTIVGFRNRYYSSAVYIWSAWSYKIAIGLDPTPQSYDDYKLGAKERETTSLTISGLTESDSTAQVDISTQFLIETEKTFYEFGLFGNSMGNVYLVSRDVVSGGVTVPANSYLTVTYRLIIGTV
jgi:hypothetical protein